MSEKDVSQFPQAKDVQFPQAKDVQFTCIDEKRNQKIITFKKLV